MHSFVAKQKRQNGAPPSLSFYLSTQPNPTNPLPHLEATMKTRVVLRSNNSKRVMATTTAPSPWWFKLHPPHLSSIFFFSFAEFWVHCHLFETLLNRWNRSGSVVFRRFKAGLTEFDRFKCLYGPNNKPNRTSDRFTGFRSEPAGSVRF